MGRAFHVITNTLIETFFQKFFREMFIYFCKFGKYKRERRCGALSVICQEKIKIRYQMSLRDLFWDLWNNHLVINQILKDSARVIY